MTMLPFNNVCIISKRVLVIELQISWNLNLFTNTNITINDREKHWIVNNSIMSMTGERERKRIIVKCGLNRSESRIENCQIIRNQFYNIWNVNNDICARSWNFTEYIKHKTTSVPSLFYWLKVVPFYIIPLVIHPVHRTALFFSFSKKLKKNNSIFSSHS